MKKRYILALTVSTLLLSGVAASAASFTYSRDDAPGWEVQNIATWNTTGNTMDNMFIKVVFANNGGEETGYWSDNTGVTGVGWSLTMANYNENTFDDPKWTLYNDGDRQISQLIFSGMSGNTVFDRILDYSNEQTPGSANGQPIYQPNWWNSPDVGLAVNAHYSNLVTVNGASGVYNDLYETLTLTFSSENAGTNLVTYFGQGSFDFALDTDNVNAPVPEPTTMLLFGVGLAGLAGLKRRKK